MNIAAALLLTQMQVSGQPVATIGAVEGDTLYTLSSVVEAREDRRGNLYVIQRTPYVAVFDSLGKRIATIGRQGRGPGEFSMAGYVGVVRDTIYITDPLQRKFGVYSPEFRHIRDISITNQYPGPQEILPQRTGEAMRYARYVPTFATEAGYIATLTASDSVYRVFQPWLGSPAILDRYAVSDARVTIVVGQTTLAGIELPVPDIPLAMPAAGTLFLFQPRPVPVLKEFTSAGLGPSRALPLQQVDVPSSIKEEWAERISTQWGDNPPAPPDGIRKALNDAGSVPERSAFATLRPGGPEGDIWLEQKLPGRPVRMVQVTPAGQLVGSFDVPDGTTVLSIRAGHVWLLELNEYDVPFLRRYRLVD